mgnify:CR=1 FL=1
MKEGKGLYAWGILFSITPYIPLTLRGRRKERTFISRGETTGENRYLRGIFKGRSLIPRGGIKRENLYLEGDINIKGRTLILRG